MEKLKGKWLCQKCKSKSGTPKSTPVQNKSTLTPANGSLVTHPPGTPIPVFTGLDSSQSTFTSQQCKTGDCSYCHKVAEHCSSLQCFFCSEWEHAGCRSLHADLFLAIKHLTTTHNCLSTSVQAARKGTHQNYS